MRWRSCACSSWRARAARNAVRFRAEARILVRLTLFSRHRRTSAYNLFSPRKGRSGSLPMTIELAPSILSANFARLGEEAKAALDGGGTVLHCDLMIEQPDEFIPAFAEAGASWISVHQEACFHLHRTLQQIELHGCKSGVVLNPATPVHMVEEVLDMVHHVLVMSVNPGFGAQKFIPGALHKIKTLAEVREELGLSFRIEVDGGVALDTVGDVVREGAELLVAGNAVFAKGNVRENAKTLLEAARAATLTRA